MIKPLILFVAAASLLAACSKQADQGAVYARPVDKVRSTLMATNLPFPLQGTDHAEMQTEALSDGTIELAIADAKGQKQLRFVAKTTEVAKDKTAVAVSFVGAGKAYPEVAKRIVDHPEIEAVYLKAVREQVASQIEERPFNNMSVGPEMMVATMANMGTIAKQMKDAGDEFRRRDKANIDKAYAAEAKGQW